MISFRNVRRPVGSALLAMGLAVAASQDVLAGPDLPWTNQLFERVSVEEDVRDVLRSILKQSSLAVNFRPDVAGNVSFSFANIPLEAAFKKLIEENNLDYDFDARTHTVTIYKIQKRAEDLVTLTYTPPEQVERAAARLKLGGEIIADRDTGIVMLRGTEAQVGRLKDLIKSLEGAGAEREKGGIARVDAESKLLDNQAKRDAADERARLREERLNTKVEIIQLKYATVGPTTQTFQGQPVTIPGVDETLRSLLGLGESKGGDKEPKDAKAGSALLTASVTTVSTARQERDTVPTDISIDPRTNSIIVRGSPTVLAQVRDLIKQLDKPLPLIEIEVIIVRARKGVAEELGLRWGASKTFPYKNGQTFGTGVNTGIDSTNVVSPFAAQANPFNSQTSSSTRIFTSTDGGITYNPTGGTTTTPNSTTSSTFSGSGNNITRTDTTTTNLNPLGALANPLNPITLLPTGLGGTLASFIYQGTNLALQAQLQALSQAEKTQTVSSPRVVTLNNIKAKVTNDRSQFLATPPAPNQAGDLKEVKAGLVMDITPAVITDDTTGDKLIRLAVNAKDTDVTTSAQGRPALVGNEVQTQVVIPNGATFVMGGLMNDFRREGKDGVPGLQDIPLLGALFKSRTSANELDETIFFITPRIVQPTDAYAQDIAERRYLQGQRAQMSDLRRDIKEHSQLLRLHPSLIEEDE